MLSQCAVLYWPENCTGPDLLGLLNLTHPLSVLCQTFVVQDSATKYVDVVPFDCSLKCCISGSSEKCKLSRWVKKREHSPGEKILLCKVLWVFWYAPKLNIVNYTDSFLWCKGQIASFALKLESCLGQDGIPQTLIWQCCCALQGSPRTLGNSQSSVTHSSHTGSGEKSISHHWLTRM